MTDPDDRLVQAFGRMGRRVDEAVPAFSGWYPASGGFSSWEMLFTRHRILARSGAQLGAWRSVSGPEPTTQLTSLPIAALRTIKFCKQNSPLRRYDRIALGSDRYWIHRRYRKIVLDWLEFGSC